MQFNSRKGLISLKIVYYGPGLSGKTTNLVRLHERAPERQRGELLRLDTETERTLFFDYFPLNVGKIGGYRVKVDLFTVPGQSFYQQTRRAVLEGADGVVFVADSSPDREQANLLSLADMEQTLTDRGERIETFPLVFQWNKRDVKRPMSLPMMEKLFNPHQRASFPATAIDGEGVVECSNAIISAVLTSLRARSRERRSG